MAVKQPLQTPSKVYTIAVLFTLGEFEPADQLWVAHFRHKVDAFKAFKLKVKECFGESGGSVPTLGDFDDLIQFGNGYNAGGVAKGGLIFVRHQPLREVYVEGEIKWD